MTFSTNSTSASSVWRITSKRWKLKIRKELNWSVNLSKAISSMKSRGGNSKSFAWYVESQYFDRYRLHLTTFIVWRLTNNLEVEWKESKGNLKKWHLNCHWCTNRVKHYHQSWTHHHRAHQPDPTWSFPMLLLLLQPTDKRGKPLFNILHLEWISIRELLHS